MSQDDQRNQPNQEPDAERLRQAAAGTPGDQAGEPGGGANLGASEGAALDDQAGAAAGAPAGDQAGEAGAAAGLGMSEKAARSDQAGAASEPGAGANLGASEARTTGKHAREATMVGGAVAAGAAGSAADTEPPHREFHEPGEGAPRYADTADETPRSGSEQSWSAAPNPGYQADPALHYTTKRLVVSTLIGVLLIGGGMTYVYRIVTNRSGNGFGAAPWTAAVKHDGAYVGGINAQNNGVASPVDLPKDASLGTGGTAAAAAVNKALAVCHTASGVSVPVTDATGTTASIGNWSMHATPSVQSLRADAIKLQTALTGGDATAVANAADTLCSAYPRIAALQPMPDAVGSKAWSSAVGAFSTAATESLRGAGGNPDATAAALDNIAQGDKQLNALSSRIIAAT